MPPRHCCCSCDIADDDFNRADNPDPGTLWDGDAEILSNRLVVSDLTSITKCNPSYSPLGSVRAIVTLCDCATAGPFKMRLGDPAGDLEVEITFTGTFGVNGKMTIAVTGDGEAASYEYDWEVEEETVYICYSPETQLSCGPTSRSSQAPQWVTICIDVVGQRCWDSNTHGNFHFLSGTFDDFLLQVHKVELSTCLECDCYCYQVVDRQRISVCIPPLIHITLASDCNVGGTYEMHQLLPVSVTNSSPPSGVGWPQKQTWISATIVCPAADATVHRFAFILECYRGSGDYPKFVLRLVRWGTGLVCSGLGFDGSDPDTIIPSAQGPSYFDSSAYSTAGSTCDPFILYFPDIIENDFGCSNCWETGDPPSLSEIACCGGCVQSGGGGGGGIISDPTYITAIVTL
jgi:hypothetical protein